MSIKLVSLCLQKEPRDSTSDITLGTAGSQSDTVPSMANWGHGASTLDNSYTNNKKKTALSIKNKKGKSLNQQK